MTRLKIETEFRIRASLRVFCYSAYNCSLFQTILRLFDTKCLITVYLVTINQFQIKTMKYSSVTVHQQNANIGRYYN